MSSKRDRKMVTQWWMLFLARAFCQGTRLLTGALLPLIAEPSWTVSNKGQLLGIFSLGYLVLQISGGSLADAFGAKPLLLGALLATGGLLLLSAVAPATDYLAWLMAIQSVMGLLQGVTYPCDCSLNTKWTPRSKRAMASSITELGSPTGALLAVTVGPVLGSRLGWRGTYAAFGVATLVAACVFALLAQSHPPSMKELPSPSVTSPSAATWRKRHWIVSHASTWSVFYAHGIFNISKYFVFNWMPTFFVDVLDVNLQRAGLYMTAPVLIEAFCALCVGARSSANERMSGRSTERERTASRRNHSSSAFVCTGLCIVGCSVPVLQTVPVVTLLMSLQGLTTAFHAGGFRPNYMDVSQVHTGFIAGLGNTVATFASYLGAVGAAALINSFGWSSPFVIVLLLNFSGAYVFQKYASSASRDDAPDLIKPLLAHRQVARPSD